MPPQNLNPSKYSLVPGSGAGSTPAIPQVQTQRSTTNLGVGGAVDFDFSSDTNPLFDGFVFADQILTVVIFIREASTGTFRQWGAVYTMPTASAIWAPFSAPPGSPAVASRIPGTNVRIEVQNNSGVATTTLAVQFRASSL